MYMDPQIHAMVQELYGLDEREIKAYKGYTGFPVGDLLTLWKARHGVDMLPEGDIVVVDQWAHGLDGRFDVADEGHQHFLVVGFLTTLLGATIFNDKS